MHGVPADPFLGGLRSTENIGALNLGINDSKSVGFEANTVSARDLATMENTPEYLDTAVLKVRKTANDPMIETEESTALTV